ncbi:MAG: hypothetical protein COB79_00865 [Zetaproteobacteria bacterium]|nr:MAG: hypothetical protein COB79_00865 [Zetaproteobacteria bacterium]
MIQSLSSHKESIRSMLFLIVGVPIFLLLDSEHGDALVGNGQWVANILVFLAFIRAYRNGTQRVRNVLLIGVIVGLLGEFLFSRVLGMYHYRLDNIPLWLAFAHGLIFAWTLKMAKKPFLQAYSKKVQAVLLIISIGYSIFWLIWANDVYGFITAVVFMLILFFTKKSRLFFLIMFVVVCYIEQVGTVTGCWHWPPIALGMVEWLPSGNPPSGISVFYFLFDAVVFWIYLYILHPKVRLRYQRKKLRK